MGSLDLIMFLTAEGQSHWLTPDVLAYNTKMTSCTTHKRLEAVSKTSSLPRRGQGSTLTRGPAQFQHSHTQQHLPARALHPLQTHTSKARSCSHQNHYNITLDMAAPKLFAFWDVSYGGQYQEAVCKLYRYFSSKYNCFCSFIWAFNVINLGRTLHAATQGIY